MIVSVHIADAGLPRTPSPSCDRPRARRASRACAYAETTVIRRRSAAADCRLPGSASAMIAAWDDDDALEDFCRRATRWPRLLAGGWQARLEPLRVYGAWPAMPGLPERQRPRRGRGAGGGPDPRPAAAAPPAALPAQRRPRRRGGRRRTRRLLASIGLARPPRLVSTFSLWRSAAEMRDYADARRRGAHMRRRASRPRAPLPPRIGLHPLPPLRAPRATGKAATRSACRTAGDPGSPGKDAGA